ncbi:MAG: hypothetical protein MMC33_002832 [Icmadophila ericetorum]|nr:hypothetical protein [Icmadophila ericetorum]
MQMNDEKMMPLDGKALQVAEGVLSAVHKVMIVGRATAKLKVRPQTWSGLPGDQFSPVRSEMRMTQSVTLILKNVVQFDITVIGEEERRGAERNGKPFIYKSDFDADDLDGAIDDSWRTRELLDFRLNVGDRDLIVSNTFGAL